MDKIKDLLVAIGILLLLSPYSSRGDDSEAVDYRLPRDIVPRHYDISIITKLNQDDNFMFTGTVNIMVEVLKETKSITLHSKELSISSNAVSLAASETPEVPLSVDAITLKEDVDFLTVPLQQPLQPGKYILKLEFQGKLADSPSGFFRDSYEDSKGETHWLASTHMQPTDARRVFPCFDEPEFKATFSISVGRPDDKVAISNMPLVSSSPIAELPGYTLDVFAESVPMSTYLVAFSVNDFKFQETSSPSNSITFRVWARESALDQVAYAAELGPRFLSYYEDYFDMKFPLPKQDLIAIPNNPGAMENWGLITFQEPILLYSPHSSSSASKFRLAQVVAHELAHQWFGNLVTMKWWNDLWLNEGFATYLAQVAVDELEPEWNVLDEEAADMMANVFKIDSLSSTHPVSVPIHRPEEIGQIFDVVSYLKGGALLRMTHMFLGNEAFKEGVRIFLKKHKYGNAEQDDLWESLTEAAHKYEVLTEDMTVKQIMDNWTKQTGYPLLTVTRDYQHNTAGVKQERFTEGEHTEVSDTVWWVPLNTMTAENPSTVSSKAWLKTVERNDLPAPASDQWLLFNKGLIGVFRVNYDAQNWDLLIQALNSPKYTDIPTLNRYQLILDVMDIADSGKLGYDTSFRLLKYLAQERSFIPWRGALNNLEFLDRRLQHSDDYEVFKAYMRGLLTPAFTSTAGLHTKTIETPDKQDAVKHQVLISKWSCDMGVPGCKENALQLFTEWINQDDSSANNIPSDLRKDVYCYGVESSGEQEWEKVWARYKSSQVASEKEIMLRALGCSGNTQILNRLLEMGVSEDSGIPSHEFGHVFEVMRSTAVGFVQAKNFLYQKTQQIHDYYSDNPGTLGMFAFMLSMHISTQEEANEFKEWIARNENQLESSSMFIQQAQDFVGLTLGWISSHKPQLVHTLRQLTEQH